MFLAPDPAASTSISGTYTYAAANPLRYIDSTGLFSWDEMLDGVQQVSGIVSDVAGVVAIVAACTGVGAPVAAIAGGISIAAGAVHAGTRAIQAYNTCNTGKGSCGDAVADALLSAAAIAPAGRLIKGAANGAKALSRASEAAKSGDDVTRVGRWMGEDELAKMQKTGLVQEGGGGRTFVTNPADPAAYPAGKGVFAEFNVPTQSLFPAGKPEWSVIPGPNVTTRRFGPPPSQMPTATCIVVLCRR